MFINKEFFITHKKVNVFDFYGFKKIGIFLYYSALIDLFLKNTHGICLMSRICKCNAICFCLQRTIKALSMALYMNIVY